jgi:hypothetical protein
MTDVAPIRTRLEQSHAGLLEATAQIPAQQWQQRPGTARWSAAEVLSHLTTVERRIQKGAETELARDPRPVPFWRRLHIPPKLSEYRLIKVKAPLPLDTSILDEKEVMLEGYAEVRTQTVEILEENAKRDLRRWRWPHPILGSLDGVSWFAMIACHEVRHTKQLREIAQALR